MFKKLFQYISNTDGAMIVEYSFIAAGIGFVLIAATSVFAGDFSDMMGTFSGYLDNATSSME